MDRWILWHSPPWSTKAVQAQYDWCLSYEATLVAHMEWLGFLSQLDRLLFSCCCRSVCIITHKPMLLWVRGRTLICCQNWSNTHFLCSHGFFWNTTRHARSACLQVLIHCILLQFLPRPILVKWTGIDTHLKPPLYSPRASELQRLTFEQYFTHVNTMLLQKARDHCHCCSPHYVTLIQYQCKCSLFFNWKTIMFLLYICFLALLLPSKGD